MAVFNAHDSIEEASQWAVIHDYSQDRYELWIDGRKIGNLTDDQLIPELSRFIATSASAVTTVDKSSHPVDPLVMSTLSRGHVVANPNTRHEGRRATRRRRPVVILVVLAALAVGGVAVAYLALFTDDAPDRLALSEPVTSAAANTGATTAGGIGTTTPLGAELMGTWRAASGSEAGYRVREKLAALPAKSDAVGRSPAVTGSVKVDRSGGSLVATDANFEVDLTKLASDESRRDTRIRTDGLQTSQFPKATFVSTKAISLPAEITSRQAVKATAEGDLTLHGVTKRVTIPIDVRVTGNKGELVGLMTFPMSDFNINPPSIGGFVTVDPDATLEFKLVLEKV